MSTRTSRVAGAAALVGATVAIGVASTPATAFAHVDVKPPEVVVDHLPEATSATLTIRNPNPAGLVPYTFCQAYIVPAGTWNAQQDTVFDLIGHATVREPGAAAMLAPVDGGRQATYALDRLEGGNWDVVGLCDDVYLPEMNAAVQVVGTLSVTRPFG
ncbi:hypothetical protein [Rhodococcus triatomae]